ncbi:BgTH12-06722 [Blumeria graminis f. sp. triticale]|uniref:Bgt-3464 n=3 Tax=Blumeria graminis TaxID=34373 RepID=A0A061HL91_BLUGR|nr:Peroxisomal integral membrane peroxin [Blumeria graminis f. sp. tritici 96224]CAD6501022.1 BgTH12-06722 [Blumeria graminis f. sp. triticale]VCU41334.1 Bgt-3464 [Blumeria graminis f. sp. tritici]
MEDKVSDGRDSEYAHNCSNKFAQYESDQSSRHRRSRTGDQERIYTEFQQKSDTKPSRFSASMQGKLIEMILQKISPWDDASARSDCNLESTTRPGFSIPLMTANFRQFNARISVVFEFQRKIAKLLSWDIPTQTMSFLALYTLTCLNPDLICVFPVAAILLALLIPSYTSRYFAQFTTESTQIPAPTINPVREMSKDFFRNMCDLQNSMGDFCRIHDQCVSLTVPLTNFSDELLSSAFYNFSFAALLIILVLSPLLPWQIIFLLFGWVTVGIGHPTIQRKIIGLHENHFENLKAKLIVLVENWVTQDIILDSNERFNVEIFELQVLSSAGEWEPCVFSTSPFDPGSEARIQFESPKGTRFIEDVKPPAAWEWDQLQWELDPYSYSWVEERDITGVEVEMDDGSWVFDLRYENTKSTNEAEEQEKQNFLPEKKSAHYETSSWEEGCNVTGDPSSRRGEWRRRRWTRSVKRIKTPVLD